MRQRIRRRPAVARAGVFCALCLIAAVIVAGCGHTPRTPASDSGEGDAETAARSPLVDPAGSPEFTISPSKGERYFYFMESQRFKKEGKFEQAAAALEKGIQRDPDSYYLKQELINLYLRMQQKERALEILNALLEDAPDNIDLLILYGRLMEGEQDDQAVVDVYRKVLKRDPNQKDIHIRLGAVLMEMGDADAAFRVYKELTDRFPDAYVGYFFMGKIMAERERFDEAERYFRKTLDLAPQIDEPKFELLNIFEKQKRVGKAIALCQRILADDPDNTRARLALGYLYHISGSAKKSARILAGLGEESIADPGIIRSVIGLYIEPKRYREAAVVLEGMIRGAPEQADLHYMAGVAYEGLEKREQMIRHLLLVTPDSRFYPNAVVHLAYSYQSAGQVEKAVSYMIDVIERSPENPDYFLYLGTFYEELTKYALAESTLLTGIRLAPENTRLYFRLGVVYDKWGRKDDSIAMMRRVIEMDPKDANALNYLGYTYADMGENLDEAERLIAEALRIKPDDGYIIDSMGWVLYKKGAYGEALTHLLRAETLVPDDPTILEHIGDVYLKLGDLENALTYYLKSRAKRDADEMTEIQTKIDRVRAQMAGS